jgi:hypothetical protein
MKKMGNVCSSLITVDGDNWMWEETIRASRDCCWPEKQKFTQNFCLQAAPLHYCSFNQMHRDDDIHCNSGRQKLFFPVYSSRWGLFINTNRWTATAVSGCPIVDFWFLQQPSLRFCYTTTYWPARYIFIGSYLLNVSISTAAAEE